MTPSDLVQVGLLDAEGGIAGVHVVSTRSVDQYTARYRRQFHDVSINEVPYGFTPVWAFRNGADLFFGEVPVTEPQEAAAPKKVTAFGVTYECFVVWRIPYKGHLLYVTASDSSRGDLTVLAVK